MYTLKELLSLFADKLTTEEWKEILDELKAMPTDKDKLIEYSKTTDYN